MISILVLFCGRPDWLARTIRTAFVTATYPEQVEFVVNLPRLRC